MTENTGKVRRISIPAEPELPPLPEIKKPTVNKRILEEQEKQEAEALIAKFAALNKEDYAELSESPRRRSREAALLLFYQMEMGGEDWALAENVLDDITLTSDCAYFAKELAHNAAEDKPESDRLLEKYAREWTVDRFASVDRCVLRLAVSELIRGNGEDNSIIINEAIELAKKFGDENSGPFVNGILDSIRINEFAEATADPLREDAE